MWDHCAYDLTVTFSLHTIQPVNIPAWMVWRGSQGPYSSWGAVDSWWLLGKGESVCSDTLSKLLLWQWVALYLWGYGSSNWTLAYKKEEKANMKLGERLGEVGVRKSGVDTVKLHCGSVWSQDQLNTILEANLGSHLQLHLSSCC